MAEKRDIDPFGEVDFGFTNQPASPASSFVPHDASVDADPFELSDDGGMDDFDFVDESEPWDRSLTPTVGRSQFGQHGHTQSSRQATVLTDPQVPHDGRGPGQMLTPQVHPVALGADSRSHRSMFDRLKDLFSKTADTARDDQTQLIATKPTTGSINIAFVNRKGGVGKTLTATLAGMMLANVRNNPVIAVDASPEGGELCDRVPREQDGSVRALLNSIDSITRQSHLRAFTSQDTTGLEILGSDPNAVGEPELTADEYKTMVRLLRQYYQFILTDCAQGVNTPVMSAVLEEADVLVLVSEGADGMRSATWVASQLAGVNGRYGGKYAHLVDDLIVVVTQRSERSNIDMGKVSDHFRGFAREVIELPFDQALEGGRPFTLDGINDSTYQAGLDLAQAIVTSKACG